MSVRNGRGVDMAGKESETYGYLERLTALNPEKTLYETSIRDLWQLELITADGQIAGRVIRQVIEPKMYTIRYLIVYSVGNDRHILLPSNIITRISELGVYCSAELDQINDLPDFSDSLDRQIECTIHQTLNVVPYWEEESNVRP